MKGFLRFLCICVLLCSCVGQKAPVPARTLRLNLKNEPVTLDPRRGGDAISAHMHFLLFEGLTRLDAEGKIVPAQAERIEISEDGTRYTFHLRKTCWSDGSLVTAEDFENTWKDILSPTFPSLNAQLFYPIKNAEKAKRGLSGEVGVKAVNAQTLIVELEYPTPYFLELISFCAFFPVKRGQDPMRALDAGAPLVSNGPFLLKKWKHQDALLVTKNPLYWDKRGVQLDAIHFSMVGDESTALQLFERGELDMIGPPFSPLPVDALGSLEKKGKLYKHPTAATTVITFNTQTAPFCNVHMRKAFCYAIDREMIVQNITQLNEQIATDMIPPVLKQSGPHTFFKDHDVETAQHLFEQGLQELGLRKEDLKLHFLYSSGDLNHLIAQALQQQWQQAFHIPVLIENSEHKVLMDRLVKRDYAFAQTLWIAQYNDRMNILERFKFRTNAKNYPHWEHPTYIELLNASAFASGAERVKILERAEALFLEEMPVAPLFHWTLAFLVKPHLKEIPLSPTGGICFEKISFSEETP